MRIEDTDRTRSSDEASQAIFDGLSWLGIDWDEKPISQYSNKNRHKEIAEQLVDTGHAYRCYCTTQDLMQMRENAKKNGLPPRYDGRCRNVAGQDVASTDVPYVIRIKTPHDQDIIVDDKVQGEVRFKTQNLDDFIVLRSDGTPTYMLAVVVDDHDMAISHIIRGDDHLTNTARQIVIYQAMGWPVPVMVHIPLIHGADGAKLSKRHGALGVDAYRKMGYLPEAVCNYLARLGWSHGNDEFFGIEQLVEWFDFDGLNKGASRFDFAKLENLNGHHIRQTDPKRLYDLMLALAKELENSDDVAGLVEEKLTVLAMLPELQPRAKTILDLISLAQFIYTERPLEIEEKAAKHLTEETRAHIFQIAKRLEALEDWNVEATSDIVREYAQEKELKLGKVAQPLRVALTGRTVSAGVFEIMVAIGKQDSLHRLKDQAKL